MNLRRCLLESKSIPAPSGLRQMGQKMFKIATASVANTVLILLIISPLILMAGRNQILPGVVYHGRSAAFLLALLSIAPANIALMYCCIARFTFFKKYRNFLSSPYCRFVLPILGSVLFFLVIWPLSRHFVPIIIILIERQIK